MPLGRSYLALAALATSAGLAGCGDDPEEQVYCADADGVIVDDDYCDDDSGFGGAYFLWAGAFGRGLKPGYKLSGGTKFAYNDAAARARYGLPTSGKVGNGTVVPGGFGSGSKGSSGG